MIGNKNQIISFLLQQKDETKFELKEYREKRGLRANRYYWSLINELANVLRMSKEDLHFKMLQNYGQFEIISVLAKINIGAFVKYYTKCGESSLNGKDFIHYKIYKRSSEMNSREFSILLDGLIQECKQQDIQILSDIEIKEMIKEYELEQKNV